MISSGILISRRIFYYLFKPFNVIFQCVKYTCTSPVRDHICFCQETQSIAAHQTHPQFSTRRFIDCRDGIGHANHVLSMYARALCAKEWCIRNCAPPIQHAPYLIAVMGSDLQTMCFHVRPHAVLCEGALYVQCIRKCACARLAWTCITRCVWPIAVPFSCAFNLLKRLLSTSSPSIFPSSL